MCIRDRNFDRLVGSCFVCLYLFLDPISEVFCSKSFFFLFFFISGMVWRINYMTSCTLISGLLAVTSFTYFSLLLWCYCTGGWRMGSAYVLIFHVGHCIFHSGRGPYSDTKDVILYLLGNITWREPSTLRCPVSFWFEFADVTPRSLYPERLYFCNVCILFLCYFLSHRLLRWDWFQVWPISRLIVMKNDFHVPEWSLFPPLVTVVSISQTFWWSVSRTPLPLPKAGYTAGIGRVKLDR